MSEFDFDAFLVNFKEKLKNGTITPHPKPTPGGSWIDKRICERNAKGVSYINDERYRIFEIWLDNQLENIPIEGIIAFIFVYMKLNSTVNLFIQYAL